MLLTLFASCLKSLLLPTGKSKKAQIDLLDLPSYVKGTLGLGGINLSTDVLVGSDRPRLEKIRDRTDRAGCSCLLLVEGEPQNFAEKAGALQSIDRMRRVIEAAHILGCSAASLKVAAPDTDEALLQVAQRLKPVVELAEKRDLNLLVSPMDGLTSRPERVTDLLKKIGGFRIGTLPDFQTAAASKDPAAYLHRITPYATVVCASTVELISKGARKPRKGMAPPPAEYDHKPYDIGAMVDAILAVGYDGPLGIDYRGEGDPIAGVDASKLAILSALGEHPADLAEAEADIMEELDEAEDIGIEEEDEEA